MKSEDDKLASAALEFGVLRYPPELATLPAWKLPHHLLTTCQLCSTFGSTHTTAFKRDQAKLHRTTPKHDSARLPTVFLMNPGILKFVFGGRVAALSQPVSR